MGVLGFYISATLITIGFLLMSPILLIALPIFTLISGFKYLCLTSKQQKKQECFILKHWRRDFKYIWDIIKTVIRIKLVIRYYDGHFTFADIINLSGRSDKKKEALVYINNEGESKSYTYGDLDGYSSRVSNWAISKDVDLKAGHTVALIMNNSPEFVFIIFGLMKLGVEVALINPNLKGKGLIHSLKVCNCSFVIYPSGEGLKSPADPASIGLQYGKNSNDEIYSNVADIKSQIEDKKIRFIEYINSKKGKQTGKSQESSEYLVLDEFSPTLCAKIQREYRKSLTFTDTALHIFTSGTTGLPKAARIHSLRMLGGAYGLPPMIGSGSDSRIYCSLPLYHSSALILGLMQAAYLGATIIVREKFSASQFWKDCYHHKADTIMYIGELCRYLVNSSPGKTICINNKMINYEKDHSVKKALGNGLRPDIWKKFIDRFNVKKIFEFYASTEGNANFMNTVNKFGSVGFISPLIKAKLPLRIVKYDHENDCIYRNDDSLCEDCDIGELIGKITDDPHMRFDGYTDKKATEKKIIHDVFTSGDKYFRTGDIVKVDRDGFVSFVDRIGDTFRWKGENVSTAEVADVFSEVPGVTESTVYGVQISPESSGRAGMSFLIVDANFDLSEVYPFLKERLPSYAIPCFLKIKTLKGELESTKDKNEEGISVTATFKHRKVELVEAGFKSNETNTESETVIYYLDIKKSVYSTLTKHVYEEITNGKIRF